MDLFPETIIKGIVRHCVGPKVQCLYMWKPKLLWLQITRRWTQIGRRYVYSEAFLECYMASSRALNNIHMRALDGAPTDRKWVSNIDLIASSGFNDLVSKLGLKLATAMAPVDFYRAVTDILTQHTSKWPAINHVAVDMTRQFDQEMESSGMADVCQSFSQILEGVQQVEAGCDSLAHTRMVCGLIAMYVGQLSSLKLLDPMWFDIPSFEPTLRTLTVALGSSEIQRVPLVFAASLEHLTVHCLPRHFSWSHFTNNESNDGDTICFEQLVELRLNFMLDTENPGTLEMCKEVELSFPKLKQLVISGCIVESCNSLLAHTYPSSIENVVFGGSVGGVAMLARASFDTIDNLLVEVVSVAETDADEFYEATNRLYCDVAIGHEAALSIGPMAFKLDMHRLMWPRLTDLVLQQPVEFYDVVELIEALPALKSIEIAQMRLERFEDESEVVRFGERLGEDTEPFGAPVTKLHIAEVACECPFQVAAGAVQFLMIKMPRLQQLVIDEYLDEYLEMFADEYCDEIPHLAEINIFGT
ncbi:hypothetical protein LPJ73_002954 [Coemansia sp. RSA 2703]|nr:hypothetical protein LPJ73_002954 [Coemansia sp. RSA 2703]KAJ2368993.1 hypothetical protein IW150_005268 [Coemansia sp. RSA 2607]KAJ2394318.1 hypothetical protein GGI05_002087 [Coemansia sp. RSA 2603]